MELDLIELKKYLNQKVWMSYIEVSPKGFKLNGHQIPIEVTVTKIIRRTTLTELHTFELEDIFGNKYTNRLSENCKGYSKGFFTTRESAIKYYNTEILKGIIKVEKQIKKLDNTINKLRTNLIG